MLLECPDCEAVVDAEVVSTYEITNDDHESVRTSFARCPKCQGPFLAREWTDIWDDTWSAPVRLYPLPESLLGESLPKPIRAAFAEAQKSFKAKCYTASAIMCRKTLEGICAVHDINKGNLAVRLKAMKDQALIESRLYEWAEALRIFGNEAAHDVDVTIAPRDAADIIDFTNALIEYVFTFRDKFEEFKNRRKVTQTST